MPQRQQTPEEWAYIVRAILNAQHVVRSIPRKPELTPSLNEQAAELEEALRKLGFDHTVDPLPPEIGQ